MTVLIALYLCSMIAGFIYRIVALMDRSVYDFLMGRWGFLLVFGFHAIPAFFLGFMLYNSYVPVEAIHTEVLLVSLDQVL